MCTFRYDSHICVLYVFVFSPEPSLQNLHAPLGVTVTSLIEIMKSSSKCAKKSVNIDRVRGNGGLHNREVKLRLKK